MICRQPGMMLTCCVCGARHFQPCGASLPDHWKMLVVVEGEAALERVICPRHKVYVQTDEALPVVAAEVFCRTQEGPLMRTI